MGCTDCSTTSISPAGSRTSSGWVRRWRPSEVRRPGGKLQSVETIGERSGRLLLRQAELFFHQVAHLEFLDLAGDGLREGVDELDMAGDFEVGELLFAVVAELVGGGLLARFELDPGGEL